MGQLAACLIMAVCFGGIGISEASMQDQSLPTLYFITRDNASHDTSLWQASLSPNSAQRILSIEFVVPDTQTARFSEHELSELNAAINRGGFRRSDANTPGVAQALSGVWWLDGNQLLVSTRNEVCDRPMRTCYGYFEFLTLDIPSATLTSLLKVDYHNQAVLQWDECTPSTGVYIDQVVPNPVRSAFVFTIRPLSDCQPVSRAQAYLVDYETLPVAVTEIPFAGGISWSPGGANLVYYSQDMCQNTACTTSVRILPIAAGATPLTITSTSLPFSVPLFVEWMDNKTVMYQWLVSPDGTTEGTRVLRWYDIIDDSTIETAALPFQQNGVYLLIGDQSHIIGINYDGSAVGMAAERALSVIGSFPEVAPIYYNSGYPRYLLMNLDSNNSFTVVDSDLNQSTINLAQFVPPSTERIVYVTVGEG